MSVSSTLLVGVLALLSFVGAYALAYVGIAIALFRRRLAERPGGRPARGQPVTVLIPSHHEGEALVDAVNTVLAQDYRGAIAVWILVADESDSSLPALREAFPSPPSTADHQPLLRRAMREVHLWHVGRTAKHDKLRFALTRVQTPFVAVLDADHRAEPGWISAALARLVRDDLAAVQGRRRPLSRSRLVEIWDSTESHLGNEAINAVVGRDFAFFTGTTAVFRREVLLAHGIPDCVTEDTYLSWQCLLAGERIGHEDRAGSYEEVAPSLRAFVARRRRWSAGHTRSFVDHARGLLRARLGGVRTLRFLLYGAFYLVPVAVLALLLLQAAHVLIQLPRRPLAAALLAASGVAPLVARLLDGRVSLIGAATAAACVLPLSTAATVGWLALTGSEVYYYLLPFPWSRTLGLIELALWWAPLLPLLAGNRRLRVLRWREVALVALSWPLSVLVNVYAGTLGFIDCCAGRSVWTRIPRQNVVSPGLVPAALARRLTTARPRAFRWAPLGWLAGGALLVVILNEVLATNECGVVRPLLWHPLLLGPSAATSIDVAIQTRWADADSGALDITVEAGGGPRPLELSLAVDGQPRRTITIGADRAGGALVHHEAFPLGWNARRVEVSARGQGLSCQRKRLVSTAVEELRGGALYVNGEPFLIKGVVPSFSAAPLALPMREGLGAIKAIGANSVRLYHQPSADTLAALTDSQLLLLAQPDLSTWQDVDATNEGDRRALGRRYARFVDATDGFPFLLAGNLGNELELGHRWEPGSAAVRAAIAALPVRRFPLSYSTYLTFVDYPVDMLGVNMLDSGPTYWRKGLDVLQRLGRPFYASELGGFVAFRERPPTALRLRRLEASWQTILDAGGLGAFIFESHDNWAQSVPPGSYNDPLRPEMPDDTRGLWDRENRPKPELMLVRRLFADVVVDVTARRADALEATVTNRRRFRLQDVTARLGEAALALGELAPGESRPLRWPLARGAPAAATAVFRYHTHHGLPGRSEVPVVIRADEPTVLNDDFVPTGHGQGYLWRSSVAELLVPDGGRRSLPLGDVVRPVDDFAWSFAGGGWQPWQPETKVGGGRHAFRFRIPSSAAGGCSLLLAGVGADSATLAVGNRTREIETHAYRELAYDLGELGAHSGDTLTLTVDRRFIEYIAGRARPDGRAVTIDFEPPALFCPRPIDLAKL